MRLSILSLALSAVIGTTASAQFMDQSVLSDEDRRAGTFIIENDSLQAVVDPYDIDATVDSLAEEFCTDGDTVSLDACQSAFGFDIHPRQTIAEARAWTMDQLLRARADAVATEARTEVLRLQLIEMELRATLQAMQIEMGIAYSADDLAEVTAEAQGYWDQVLELREELNLLQDEAAESCRMSADYLDVCDQPAHQRALERP